MATQKTTTPEKAKSPLRDTTLPAALSHLSIITVVIIGPFSLVIPLLIWLSERNRPNRSPRIEFQAKQAFFYQVAVYVICAALGVIIGLLSIIVVGLLFIPVLILFAVAAVFYGVYAGIRVWMGEDFRYIYIADFIEAGGERKQS